MVGTATPQVPSFEELCIPSCFSTPGSAASLGKPADYSVKTADYSAKTSATDRSPQSTGKGQDSAEIHMVLTNLTKDTKLTQKPRFWAVFMPLFGNQPQGFWRSQWF
jgi:hypothetical protein